MQTKVQLGFLWLTILLGQAIAQSVSLSNTTHPGLGMDFIAGDSFELTISNAEQSQTIVVNSTLNGVNQSPYTVGTTDGGGNYTLTGTMDATNVGTWTEVWSVGGIDLSPELDFVVMDKPTGVTVLSAGTTTMPSGCSIYPYGIFIDVKYQITGADGSIAQITGIPMEPYEDVQFYNPGNIPGSTASGDIGPVTGYSNSSQFAATDGTFHDVPLGSCFSGAFSGAGLSQTISIYVAGTKYPVRTQRWTTSSSSANHGSITNSIEVSASR